MKDIDPAAALSEAPAVKCTLFCAPIKIEPLESSELPVLIETTPVVSDSAVPEERSKPPLDNCSASPVDTSTEPERLCSADPESI